MVLNPNPTLAWIRVLKGFLCVSVAGRRANKIFRDVCDLGLRTNSRIWRRKRQSKKEGDDWLWTSNASPATRFLKKSNVSTNEYANLRRTSDWARGHLTVPQEWPLSNVQLLYCQLWWRHLMQIIRELKQHERRRRLRKRHLIRIFWLSFFSFCVFLLSVWPSLSLIDLFPFTQVAGVKIVYIWSSRWIT